MEPEISIKYVVIPLPHSREACSKIPKHPHIDMTITTSIRTVCRLATTVTLTIEFLHFLTDPVVTRLLLEAYKINESQGW